jgi:protein gp37
MRCRKTGVSILAALIAITPELDWLLLTKRIELFDRLAPWSRGTVPSNVWIGVTCETGASALRS